MRKIVKKLRGEDEELSEGMTVAGTLVSAAFAVVAFAYAATTWPMVNVYLLGGAAAIAGPLALAVLVAAAGAINALWKRRGEGDGSPAAA